MNQYILASALIKVKNAYAAGHEQVIVPYSNLCLGVINVLADVKRIGGFRIERKTNQYQINVQLKYLNSTPAISDVRIVSKPGLRVYKNYQWLKGQLHKPSTLILTTSKGIVTETTAVKLKVGGEVLCLVS